MVNLSTNFYNLTAPLVTCAASCDLYQGSEKNIFLIAVDLTIFYDLTFYEAVITISGCLRADILPLLSKFVLLLTVLPNSYVWPLTARNLMGIRSKQRWWISLFCIFDMPFNVGMMTHFRWTLRPLKTSKSEKVHYWRAPWKNRTSRYISFFRPSLNDVLFSMFCW